MAANDDYILEILIENSLITKSQVDDARKEAKPGKTVMQVLIDQNLITQEDVSRAVASNAAMDFVSLDGITVSGDVLALISGEAARRYRAVPVALTELGGVVVAVDDPLNFDTLDGIQALLGREVEFLCTTPASMKAALMKYYGTAEDAVSAMEGMAGSIQIGGQTVDVEGVAGEVGDAPIIKLVTMMLVEAYNSRTSDIHVEPLEKRLRIRFRIDGVLHEMQNPPKKLQAAIVSRLKIMTGTMSIAEKRLPQDGRIQVKMGKKSLDLCVSTIPTAH